MRRVAAVRGDLTCGFPYENRYICSVRLGTFPLCSNLVCSPRAAGRQVGSWRFEGDESPWHDDVHVPVLGAVVLPKVSMAEKERARGRAARWLEQESCSHDSIPRCRGRLGERPGVHISLPARALSTQFLNPKALRLYLFQRLETSEHGVCTVVPIQHAIKKRGLRDCLHHNRRGNRFHTNQRGCKNVHFTRYQL